MHKPLVPLSLLVGLVLVVLAAPTSAAAADRCMARGAHVVARNAVARVFYVHGKGELKRTWYGCLKKSKPTVLGRDVSPRDSEQTRTVNLSFALGGTYVGWVSESSSDFGAGEFGRSVNARRLKSGGRGFSQDVSNGPDVEVLVLRDDGAAAWTFKSTMAEPRAIDAVAPHAKAAAPLAYARGIKPATLAIDADGVHWTQDGVPRTARPVEPPKAPAGDPAAPGPQSLDARYGDCGALRPARSATSRFGSAAQAIAGGAGAVAVAGIARVGSSKDSVVVDRLASDGTQDFAWGGGAAVVTKVPLGGSGGQVQVTGVAVQPDGGVVVAGYSSLQGQSPVESRALLARYNADGSLDASFGAGGFLVDALPAEFSARIDDVAVAADGSIVVAGAVNDATGQAPGSDTDRFTVARYLPNGSPDPAFGGDGAVSLSTAGLGRSAAAVVRLLPGGDVLAAGEAGKQFALARLKGDGSLDATFGTGGTTYASPPAAAAIIGLAVLADGRIVAAGEATSVLGNRQLALGRYLADGGADTRFGADGFLIDPFTAEPTDIVSRPGGGFLVSGLATLGPTSSGGGLIAYDADGSRTSGFGVGGALAGFTSFGLNVNGVLLADDGTALAAAELSSELAVVRHAIDEPALAATASAARACTVNIATKSLRQLLRPGSNAPNGKLRLSFFTRQPGPLRLKAIAQVDTRSATVGAVTVTNGTYGTGIAEIKVSRKAWKLLGAAGSAQIVVTATGPQGAPAVTASRTLSR